MIDGSVETILSVRNLQEIGSQVLVFQEKDQGEWPAMLRLASAGMRQLNPGLAELAMVELANQLEVVNLGAILEMQSGDEKVDVKLKKSGRFAGLLER